MLMYDAVVGYSMLENGSFQMMMLIMMYRTRTLHFVLH